VETLKRSLEISKLIREVMYQVKHSMSKEFEISGMTCITPTQGMMIGILCDNSEIKVSDISQKMGLNNSTVSGIIDRLERQGLVERLRSEEDKRVVYIKLTKKSEEMGIGIHSRINEIFVKKVAERGTSDDYDKIIEGLSILKRLLTDKDGR